MFPPRSSETHKPLAKQFCKHGPALNLITLCTLDTTLCLPAKTPPRAVSAATVRRLPISCLLCNYKHCTQTSTYLMCTHISTCWEIQQTQYTRSKTSRNKLCQPIHYTLVGVKFFIRSLFLLVRPTSSASPHILCSKTWREKLIRRVNRFCIKESFGIFHAQTFWKIVDYRTIVLW